MRTKFEKHVKRRIKELHQREQKYRKLTFNTNYRANYNKQNKISN